MRKILFLLCIAGSMLMNAQERIMLIADPHVLPLTLIEDDPDFDAYMQTQRKMLDLSEPIWYALMDSALKYRPDLLLIAGDLTRDAEPESHALVSASLQALEEEGIKTLFIPGNHDILDDNAWDATYAWMYEHVTARDANSHSFAAQPFDGVTILGIDGSHGKASIGSLSSETLAWLLAQADEAKQQGHMVIAMCHWQLLEHIDKQQRVESSCRLKDAESIRDSLMMHGVHTVLTGHFHVNGITTYRDPEGLIPDSLVEITTGSPITYPCPFRWLTLSADRKSLSVETQQLTAIEAIPDLHAYSREWMRVHAHNLLPQMSLRIWNKVDDAKAMIAEQFGETIANRLVNNCIPPTDSAKIALVEKHIGNTTVELYLLHSDANEPDYPQADSLANEFYSGMDAMISEALDADPMVKIVMLIPMQLFAESLAQEPLQSLVEDKTQWKSECPDRTDDLHLTLLIGDGYDPQSFDAAQPSVRVEKILRNGTLYILRNGHTYTAQGVEVQ